MLETQDQNYFHRQYPPFRHHFDIKNIYEMIKYISNWLFSFMCPIYVSKLLANNFLFIFIITENQFVSSFQLYKYYITINKSSEDK